MSRLVTITRKTAEVPTISLPEQEVVEGSRDATCLFAAISRDRGAAGGFWGCAVGTYVFDFDYDEFAYLIEGRVEITQAGVEGSQVWEPGDMIHFPQGISTTWVVTAPLKKFFVARAPFTEPG